MIVALLVLAFSSGLFLFYLQTLCQRILRRQFAQHFAQSIVTANRLEFPSIRRGLQGLERRADYSRIAETLNADYMALTYLLKNAANVNQRYTLEERLLMLYFKVNFYSMVSSHLFKRRETPAALKLTAILEYFANVVGERVNSVRYGNLTASDYLLNL